MIFFDNQGVVSFYIYIFKKKNEIFHFSKSFHGIISRDIKTFFILYVYFIFNLIDDDILFTDEEKM